MKLLPQGALFFTRKLIFEKKSKRNLSDERYHGPGVYTSREVHEARRPRTCSRPCAFEEKSNRKKKTRKIPPHPKHTTKSTAATTSGRLATKHVPRVSPYSPASIDPEFVEIGLVQLSQSVKTTNVTHTLTQTDGLIK